MYFWLAFVHKIDLVLQFFLNFDDEERKRVYMLLLFLKLLFFFFFLRLFSISIIIARRADKRCNNTVYQRYQLYYEMLGSSWWQLSTPFKQVYICFLTTWKIRLFFYPLFYVLCMSLQCRDEMMKHSNQQWYLSRVTTFLIHFIMLYDGRDIFFCFHIKIMVLFLK